VEVVVVFLQYKLSLFHYTICSYPSRRRQLTCFKSFISLISVQYIAVKHSTSSICSPKNQTSGISPKHKPMQFHQNTKHIKHTCAAQRYDFPSHTKPQQTVNKQKYRPRTRLLIKSRAECWRDKGLFAPSSFPQTPKRKPNFRLLASNHPSHCSHPYNQTHNA